MPHIHTKPGEIDFTVGVFIVYKNRLLLRLHDKHNLWLTPGGHIELDETPEQAAIREIQEEVGLTVELYKGNKIFDYTTEKYQELVPPMGLNVHFVNEEHRHLEFVYFGTVQDNTIKEPETHEKSGGIRWVTKEELLASPDFGETTKQYGQKALELLAS